MKGGRSKQHAVKQTGSSRARGPLDHDERLALILKPFPIVTWGRSYRWGGVDTGRGSIGILTTTGKRVGVVAYEKPVDVNDSDGVSECSMCGRAMGLDRAGKATCGEARCRKRLERAKAKQRRLA